MTTRQRALSRTFIDPRSLVFWVGAGLVAYGLMHLLPQLARTLSYPAAAVVSALLWTVYGLVFALVLYRFELFERRSPVTMFGAFIWGAVVVSGIAVVAAPSAHELVDKLLPESMVGEWTAAFAAPLVEEPLKMLGVVALAFIPGARINSAVDGLFFGLMVGLGFEVAESYLYTISGATAEGGSFSMVVLTFVLRGIVGGLWNHPTFTAITGAGVGYFFGSAASLAKRTTALVGSLVVAMVLHGFFDSPLLENDNPFITSVLKGLPAIILLVILYRLAQGRERDRFSTTTELSVPDELIAPDELDVLKSRRGRRHARHKTRKEHGWAASHALKRLQRTQTELVTSIQDEGVDAARSQELATEVRLARDDLAQTT